MSRSHVIAGVMAGCIALDGCATMRTQMRYGQLTSQTETRESVFLLPGSDLPPTVYLEETCSADRQITVRPNLDRALAALGYRLVGDPHEATYLMQINHLQLTEVELSKDQTLGDAIGAAFAAGLAAGLAADVVGASGRAATGIGLAVGAVGFILDSQTKHIAHLLTTDVLVTEAAVVDGASSSRRHETQIVSGASKVNLRLSESLPVLVDGMSNTLAHLLPPRRGDDR